MRVCALCTLLPHRSCFQKADKNDSIPDSALFSETDCIFYGEKGKEINLTPLEGTDGKPRYTVKSSKSGYSYSYNPCRPFSKGPPEISDCYGDVAVCMWATNGARYSNIGRASSQRFGYEKDSERYRLEYSNTKEYPRWEVHIILGCDPSLKKEAEFTLLKTVGNTRRFLLKHDCICEGHCPQRPGDPTRSSGKNPGVVAGVSVAGVVLVVVAAFLVKRYCNRNPPHPLPNIPDNQLVNDQASVDHNNRPCGENQSLLSAREVSYGEESVARSGKDFNIRV